MLIYLYVDYRYTGLLFGRAAGISSWTEFIITGPVLALFAAPAVGVSAELLPVAFRKRLPMRGIAFTGLAFVALGLLAGVSQQSVAPAKWTQEAMTRHNYATKLGDVIVYALFVVVPLVGVLMVLGVGALMGKPARGAKRRLPSVGVSAPLVFAKLGITLILLGMVGNVLIPFVDLDLQGTVFEEGVTVAFVYGILLAGLGAAAWWIPKAYGARLPDLPLFGIAALAWLGALLASVPYGIAGFLDQPGYAAVWDNDGPGEFLNMLVTIGHGLVAIAVVAMLGAAGRRRPPRGRPANPTRGERADARVDHVVAGAPRQLRRGAHRDVAGARRSTSPPRPAETVGTDDLRPARRPAARRRVARCSSPPPSAASPCSCSPAGCSRCTSVCATQVLNTGDSWVPNGVKIPEVPANVMLAGLAGLLVFAQWTVYGIRRRDRVHVSLSLGLVGLLGLAIINAQVYIYQHLDLPIASSGYAGMFYAITGMVLVLLVIGVVFTTVCAFRFLGGRDEDQEIVPPMPCTGTSSRLRSPPCG